MPLQSGSDDVLQAMRRSYRSERYLGIIDKVRAAMPDAAITTDIIVGFPGETDADFERTLDVVRAARFASAFTFQYSKRPGTPAADHGRPAPKAGRAGTLRAADRLRGGDHLGGEQAPGGETVEVLVAVGEGRKDERTGRMSGRARDGRLVHFDAGSLAGQIRPGDIVHTTVTYAAPHHLNADGEPLSHRRTRAGDAAEAGRSPRTPGVLLGLPVIGAPAAAPAPATGCAAH